MPLNGIAVPRCGEPFFRTGDLCYLSTLADGTIQVSKSSSSSYWLFGCDRHWCAVTPFLRDAGILVDSGRVDILSSITMVDVVMISILLTSDDQSS